MFIIISRVIQVIIDNKGFCLVKLGTGSNIQRTQKYERVKVQNDIRTSKHINKQTSPIFNCVTPVTHRSPIMDTRIRQCWLLLAQCQYCKDAYVPCITSDITAD